MGRREWEQGKFIIPSAAWAGFKRSLLSAYNEALAADFELAKKVFERVKAAHKGRRNVDWTQAVQAELHALDAEPRSGFGGWGSFIAQERRYKFRACDDWQAQQALLTKTLAGRPALAAPRARDFAPLKRDAREFQAGSEGRIALDDSSRTVEWSVSEAKNACEQARESLMGGELFGLLSKTAWGRGSGGSIRGNDEYSEESGREVAGAGGSYLKERYGPLGDDDYERAHGVRVRRGAPAARTLR